MPPDFLDTLLDGPFELTSRPEPVPGDLRMAWGIALVILILGPSRGMRASLQKLHFMAHSARTKESREEVRRVFTGDRSPADLVVRVEPSLNETLQLSGHRVLSCECRLGRKAGLQYCRAYGRLAPIYAVHSAARILKAATR
jgi:hypothetical protein